MSYADFYNLYKLTNAAGETVNVLASDGDLAILCHVEHVGVGELSDWSAELVSERTRTVEYRHTLPPCNGHRTHGYSLTGGELVCRKCGKGQGFHETSAETLAKHP